MVKNILLTLFVLASCSSVAQMIQFSDTISREALRGLWSEYNELSHTPLRYVATLPLDGNCKNITATFADCQYRRLNADELKYASFIEPDTVIGIECHQVTTRKKPFVEVQFSPFRKSDDGSLLVLSQFTIDIYATSWPVMMRATKGAEVNSLLNEGKWFKIKVDTSGVYKLTYEQLMKIGVENPQNTRVYSYGGSQLSYICGESFDDMNEIPVFREFGSDGVFDRNDYIAFYAEGPTTLNYDEPSGMFIHANHCYSDYVYLFLTSDLGQGKTIQQSKSADGDYVSTDTYDSYSFYEKDRCNLVASGRRWYDNKITGPDSVMFYFPNIVKGEPVNVYVCAAGRKAPGVSAYFEYKYNGKTLARSNVTKSYDSYAYADYLKTNTSLMPKSSRIFLEFSFNSTNSLSEGYIDKICLNAREKLVYNAKRQLLFRDSRTANQPFIGFEMNVKGTVPYVWDITVPTEPKAVQVKNNGSVAGFSIIGDEEIHEFVAFGQENLREPIISGSDVGMVANQNLHGTPTPDMLIVSNASFMEQAEELAGLHGMLDGYDVQIATPEQIYNEFSGGTPDASAIRNYARMLYKRGDKLKYILLLGDGTYDNKNILGTGENYILTFQSEEGESQSGSYVSDDFFVMLDDGEGELKGTLDVAIGRLPVSTADEAQAVVDKIKRYTSGVDVGNWRNIVAFVADDEEGGIFVDHAEKLCVTLNDKHPEYNVNKIYLDAYEQVVGSSGATYPDVNEAFLTQMSSGAVIVEYIGHGSPVKLAHESIFKAQDVKQLTNIDRLPFLITASCEVGRFDDHMRQSVGELMVKNPQGGAIAALTTTRVVYDSENYALSNNVFLQENDKNVRIGDIVANAKNMTGSDFSLNKRNFSLLGDPALRLAHPYNTNLHVTGINGNPLEKVSCDTINAIDTVVVEGCLYDSDNNPVMGNGVLYSVVFDKETAQSTLGQDKGSPEVDFTIRNNVLYQGKSSIVDGRFKFSFIMPKDINYAYGFGRISLYAVVDSSDYSGYCDSLFVGGTPQNATVYDFDGPQIELYATDTNFIEGGIVGNNPTIIARLFDESGINTTGNGIGHDITAVLDGNQRSAIVLNNLYEGYIDKYNSGEVRFKLFGLEEGEHTLTFKAWDIYNNPSEKEIRFVVADGDGVVIGDVYNYPNPVIDETYFVVNHNQSDADVVVTIRICDVSGRKVSEIKANRRAGDVSPIYWNCQSVGGHIARGIYVYTIEISGNMGKNTKSGKMVVSRQ